MVKQESSTEILLSILGVISLILITVGVSFAFFTYEEEERIENPLNNGNLSLIYTKSLYTERGISISDFIPVDDSTGRKLNSDQYVFDFRIVGDSSDTSEIPYEITLRKDDFSILDGREIKVYLTELDEDIENPTIANSSSIRTFLSFEQTSVVSEEKEIEKTIYTGFVPANTKNYEKSFRLRIWVSDSVEDLSEEQILQREKGNPYFKTELNVYANAKTVSTGEVLDAEKIEFSDISPMVVGGTQEVSVIFTPFLTTDKTLSFTSSDNNIITITEQENGKILLTALKEGTATIEAITSNGIVERCDVTVIQGN